MYIWAGKEEASDRATAGVSSYRGDGENPFVSLRHHIKRARPDMSVYPNTTRTTAPPTSKLLHRPSG